MRVQNGDMTKGRLSESDGLRIAADVVLPPAIVGMRMPVLAEPGAGKSVFLAVLMEELWRLRLQFVSFDPLGTAWGVKASADGSSDGIAVPYLGAGRYADAPLRPDAGAIVARAFAETGVSMMLNVSGFGREEQNMFVADFWNELLLLAAARHDAGDPISALSLIDEASFFMPETARGKQHARVQDAGERIGRQGRSLGLGYVAPTQRPQAIDKDVIGVWEVLVLMRLTEPAAIAQAMGMCKHVISAEQAREIQKSLPELADGEAWIISPRVLGFVRRVKLRMRTTYDSTRTPAPGKRRKAPTTLAKADLSRLQAALAYDTPIAAAAVADTDTTAIAAELRRVIGQRDDALRRLHELQTFLRARVPTDDERKLLDAAAAGAVLLKKYAADASSMVNELGGAPVIAVAAPTIAKTRRRAPSSPKPHVTVATSADLSAGAERVLTAALERYPLLTTVKNLAFFSGWKPSSGPFRKALKELREAGRLEVVEGIVHLTPPPSSVAGGSHEARIGMVRKALREGERRYFEILMEHPRGLTIEQLERETGHKATSGPFRTALRALRENGLATLDGGSYRIAEDIRS